jgi:hypothetical protein
MGNAQDKTNEENNSDEEDEEDLDPALHSSWQVCSDEKFQNNKKKYLRVRLC